MLTSKHPDKTPYHYCSNDPINRVDPSGMEDTGPASGESSTASNNIGGGTPTPGSGGGPYPAPENLPPGMTWDSELGIAGFEHEVTPESKITGKDSYIESPDKTEAVLMNRFVKLPYTNNGDGTKTYKNPAGENVTLPDTINKLDLRKGVLWGYSENDNWKYNWMSHQGMYGVITSDREGGKNAFPGGSNITYAGKDNPQNAAKPNGPGGKKNYDYSLAPKSIIDYYGMLHDLAYDKLGIEGEDGTTDVRSLQANIDLVKGAVRTQLMYKNGEIDPFTGEPVSVETSRNAVLIELAFKGIIAVQLAKISAQKIDNAAKKALPVIKHMPVRPMF